MSTTLTACRGCGAKIIWVTMKSGKAMPCDPEPLPYWLGKKGVYRIVTPNGEVVAASLDGPSREADGIGYISHFATCPRARRFRME